MKIAKDRKCLINLIKKKSDFKVSIQTTVRMIGKIGKMRQKMRHI